MSEYRPSSFQILPPVVKNLLIINGLLLLATVALDKSMQINLYEYFGLYYPTSEHFRPHQFITHIFMHGDFWHLFFNMFAIWMFGSVIENYWGPKKFLIFYVVTALGAGGTHLAYTSFKLAPSFHYAENPNVEDFRKFLNRNKEHFSPAAAVFADRWEAAAGTSGANVAALESIQLVERVSKNVADIPAVGASGALFGILMAFGMLFPNSLIYIYFVIPLKAKYFVILYGLIALFGGLSNQAGDNVAHFAHLGGMIFGFLLIQIWKRSNRKKLY